MKMPTKYTVAIHGTGKRGKVHAETFCKDGRFEVVAILWTGPGAVRCGGPARGRPGKVSGSGRDATRDQAGCLLLLHSAFGAAAVDSSGHRAWRETDCLLNNPWLSRSMKRRRSRAPAARLA